MSRFMFIHDFPGNGEAIGPQSRKDLELPLGLELPAKDVGTAFRWYHVAVNDTKWIEHCLIKISELNGYNGAYNAQLVRSWERNERPANSLPKNILSLHCRFMEPSCKFHDIQGYSEQALESRDVSGPQRRPNQPPVSIVLPYLNWESFERVEVLHQHRLSRTVPDKAEDGDGDGIHPVTLHQRRTLDQFYYSGLQDTRTRDAGQTVSKWTGKSHIGKNGRTKAEPTSLVVMVDQLWLWILDDGSLLSFFPSGDCQYRGQDNDDFADFYSSVLGRVRSCHDVYDLAALMVNQSAIVLFEQENKKFADLLGIYQWAIGNKAARQSEQFEAFGRRPESAIPSAPSSSDTTELSLTVDVADILDELNMLAAVLESQREVMMSLRTVLKALNVKPVQPQGGAGQEPSEIELMVTQTHLGVVNVAAGPSSGKLSMRLQQVHEGTLNISSVGDTTATVAGIGGQAGIFLEEAGRELQQTMNGVRRLKADAETTHKMLLDLLDLKQKAASLHEARSSTKQGRAVMLFTIVTIIFLPLSFFSSYFGQNVSEITGDDKNPRSADLWKIGGPLSVAVIVFALLIAYYISNPGSRLWVWKRKRDQSQV
ncbi:hypothetical protein N658DRAFT_308880 [Parathielavia hyrcaniae]|uniref:Uncharacterized protein n=1 Tax=Parathielavia hyrcaniae TaxID=113614 RepID=A0AAN6T435_9PEZI|nr:hypothetical protein N658DRAFT_308880 [Parathielavia hyrcaniae]